MRLQMLSQDESHKDEIAEAIDDVIGCDMV
jgi:hypothetical protein